MSLTKRLIEEQIDQDRRKLPSAPRNVPFVLRTISGIKKLIETNSEMLIHWKRILGEAACSIKILILPEMLAKEVSL